MIRSMNAQTTGTNAGMIRTPARKGRLLTKGGRTFASIVCAAFWLDCLADQDWPGPARGR
jgi:hypothetical protein